MSKRLPKPFKRPGISISDGSPRRTWATTEVWKVLKGDIVADFGLVQDVAHFKRRDPEQFIVRLTNVMGVSEEFRHHSQVFAFSHHG
jgi:hypothetical protein